MEKYGQNIPLIANFTTRCFFSYRVEILCIIPHEKLFFSVTNNLTLLKTKEPSTSILSLISSLSDFQDFQDSRELKATK